MTSKKSVSFSDTNRVIIFDDPYSCDGFQHFTHRPDLPHYGIFQCGCGFPALFCSKGCLKRTLFQKSGLFFRLHTQFCQENNIQNRCKTKDAKFIENARRTFFN